MKLILSTLSVIGLLTTLASAWNVDSRCLNRRLFHLNNPESSLAEDGLTPEASVAFDNEDNNHVKSDDSSKGLLRGENAHRELDQATTFRLKMYWEEGYCWQDEWEEREWCMECQGDVCNEGDYLWIKQCDDDSKQVFIYEGVSGTGGGKIKPYTRQDLCWERIPGVYGPELRPCSSNNEQIILGISFIDKFEMAPYAIQDDCMTQPHHPKDQEIIRGEFCENARYDKTSYWIMHDKNPGDYYAAVDNLGVDYCNDNLCGMCEGDCDSDDQCEGDLECFMRDANEPIPGCSGGYSSLSHGKDFCYDPNATL